MSEFRVIQAKGILCTGPVQRTFVQIRFQFLEDNKVSIRFIDEEGKFLHGYLVMDKVNLARIVIEAMEWPKPDDYDPAIYDHRHDEETDEPYYDETTIIGKALEKHARYMLSPVFNYGEGDLVIAKTYDAAFGNRPLVLAGHIRQASIDAVFIDVIAYYDKPQPKEKSLMVTPDAIYEVITRKKKE